MKVADARQQEWLLRMKANLDHLHAQWYGHDGFQTVHSGLDRNFLNDTDQKIREACRRLNIRVVEAFDEDGWDGEMYEPIVTLWRALSAIRKHFGLEDAALEQVDEIRRTLTR